MITCGIDPGTNSWKISIYNEKTFIDKEFETEKVKNEEINLDFIKNSKIDYLCAPSGYGLPLKNVDELTDEDIFKISLKKDENSDLGLRKILKKIKDLNLKAFVIPGVKHLSTVKKYKKFNVIDMGTPDKLCASLYILSKSKNFKKENFILCNIGAFNAYIKVKNGRIVDGIGGTNSSSALIAHGRIDKEFLYLNFKIEKFSGGLKSMENKNDALNYFLYGIKKDISSLIDKNIEKIYLCITNKIDKKIKGKIKNMIKKNFNLEIYEEGKFASSRGGAILMNGLFGGKFKNLIEYVKIKEAKGDIFDYIYL